MCKKIILFGAGNFGKMALKYYGEDQVAYFADNSSVKINTDICGIKCISFAEMISLKDEYQIIVASSYLHQMGKQLEEAGVIDYLYYSPQYIEILKKITNNIKDYPYNNIVFFGIDGYTKNLVKEVLELKISEVNYYLADYDESAWIGKDIGGMEVKPLSDLIEIADSVIIFSASHHAASYVYAKQRMKKTTHILNPFRQRAYYDTTEIVLNPYEGSTSENTEESWNESVKNNEVINSVAEYVERAKKDVQLFEFIEIETINRCNGVCSFCPVNKNIDPREKHIMTKELFEKIIGELENLDYGGELSLFSNNEPLLDERIIELSKYAREHLPKARIHMFSNGTLFTLEKFKQLIPYLDELIIDNYRQDLKLIKPSQEIKEYVEQHEELRKKVTIVLRKPQEILTTRGGDAPNRKEMKSYPEAKCALPFQQMIIRPDGKVSLCCNDPMGKNTLGDINKETLEEVWFGQRYKIIREALSQGRENWNHCKYCDTFYIY